MPYLMPDRILAARSAMRLRPERERRPGVGVVVIDSFDDIDRLERLVTGEQRVLIRGRQEFGGDGDRADLS